MRSIDSNAVAVVMACAGIIGCASTDPYLDGTPRGLCDETSSPISSADEVTPLGFRAGDIIQFGVTEFTTSLLWGSSSIVTFGPETGRQSLIVNITYQGGTITHVRSRPTEGSGACWDHVKIPVAVHLRSENGALDETFATHLKAATRLYATLTHVIDLDNLDGTFAVTPVTPPNGRTRQIVVDAAVSANGTTGRIAGDVEVTGSGSIGVTRVDYAIWPAADACRTSTGDRTGLPAALDAQIALFSGQDGMSLLNAAGSALSVVWDDGSSSRARLTTTSLGQGCVRFDTPAVVSPDLVATFPMRFAVTTDDGRLNGDYPADMALISAPNGDLRLVEGRADLKFPVDQAAATGFTAVGDVSGYDSLSLAFLFRAETGRASGEIALRGLKAAPCTMQPQIPDPSGGTRPCEGTHHTAIERGSWLPSPSP